MGELLPQIMPYAQSEEFIVSALAIVTLFGLPVVAWIITSLLKHQRQMAELVHGKRESTTNANDELQLVRKEITELKEVILSHSLSMDTNMDTLKRRLESVEARERNLESRQ